MKKNFFTVKVTEYQNRMMKEVMKSLLWRYSIAARTQFWLLCSRGPSLSKGVGLNDLQRSFPNSVICDHQSVKDRNHAVPATNVHLHSWGLVIGGLISLPTNVILYLSNSVQDPAQSPTADPQGSLSELPASCGYFRGFVRWCSLFLLMQLSCTENVHFNISLLSKVSIKRLNVKSYEKSSSCQ